jgi:hypothetical protein
MPEPEQELEQAPTPEPASESQQSPMATSEPEPTQTSVPEHVAATPEEYLLAAFGSEVVFERLPGDDPGFADDTPSDFNDTTINLLDE